MIKFLSILLLLSGFAAHSQSDLQSYFASAGAAGGLSSDAESRIKSVTESLASSGLQDQKLLRKTFHRVQSVFLKKYEAYSGFDQIFSTGHYDCLTATALFGYVLDQLHYSYEIVETNYHIFLIVKTARGDVLIETTDRFGGFVTGASEISSRIEKYRLNNSATTCAEGFIYQYDFTLYQQISSNKLAGLLYYNQAVKAYNHHQWEESARSLEKANALYASPRCEALGTILIQTVLESSMSDLAKNNCLSRLRHFWARKSDVVAAN